MLKLLSANGYLVFLVLPMVSFFLFQNKHKKLFWHTVQFKYGEKYYENRATCTLQTNIGWMAKISFTKTTHTYIYPWQADDGNFFAFHKISEYISINVCMKCSFQKFMRTAKYIGNLSHFNILENKYVHIILIATIIWWHIPVYGVPCSIYTLCNLSSHVAIRPPLRIKYMSNNLHIHWISTRSTNSEKNQFIASVLLSTFRLDRLFFTQKLKLLLILCNQ